jgi:hypothetical protein
MGLVYIASVTASSSASLSFTTGIDATYNEYQWHFVGIHAHTHHANFQFQVNASDDTGGGFDTSLITSTFFRSFQGESDDAGGPSYKTDRDQAQAAGYQDLSYAIDQDDGDESLAGMLTLYAPASTTYVKHFTSRTNANHHSSEYTLECFAAGYINQALAIPEISFKFHSGNIDSGTIHMYGVG